MTIQDKCCSVCGCEFNGVHPDPISDQEENLWIWLELIDANIIPYDLLVAAKERADKARALFLSSGQFLTKLALRLEVIQHGYMSRALTNPEVATAMLLRGCPDFHRFRQLCEHDYRAGGRNLVARLSTMR